MTPICFIDTETTSLRPDRRAWEVGMIRRDFVGDRECRFFIAVNDVDLPGADPFSLDVGRFWERHPQACLMVTVGGAPFSWQNDDTMWTLDGDRTAWDVPDGAVVDAADAAVLVSTWTHGAHLVGAVPNFDAEVLAALLRDNNLTPTWHHHLVDVETLAVGWLTGQAVAAGEAASVPAATSAKTVAWEFAPPWKSDDLSRELGVEPPGPDARHTALGDALWAARIYDKVIGGRA